jgi:magnesium transporter
LQPKPADPHPEDIHVPVARAMVGCGVYVDGRRLPGKLGPYAVMHAIANDVVDHYLEVTDMIEVDIDAIEEDIVSPRTNINIECMYLLKREVVDLRRSVAPLTLALRRLASEHNDLISTEVRRYMRDVLEHQIEAADRITAMTTR